MKHVVFYIVVFFSISALAQTEQRTLLKGIVTSDSLKVERATITNTTAERFAVSDDLGFFTIYARENDTLVITSVAFETTQLVVRKKDIGPIALNIRLIPVTTELDEVKIGPYKLTGDLVYDAKRIKVKPSVKADIPPLDVSTLEITGVKARVDNLAMPNNYNPETQIDFIRIAKMLFRKKQSEWQEQPITPKYTEEFFKTEITKRFDESFFTETLAIEKSKIDLFLQFSYTEEVQREELLKKEKALQLIDFLSVKSVAFLEMQKP